MFRFLKAVGAKATAAATANPFPVGTIIAYMGPKAALTGKDAEGWLICDGRPVAKDDYLALSNLLGATYGSDDDTFNLPDLRGQFLRGVDDNTNGSTDPDRANRTNPNPRSTAPINQNDRVGTRQAQQLLNHQHMWGMNFGQISTDGGGIDVQLAPTSPNGGDRGTLPTTNTDGGGNETRPVNVYVYYLIYAGR